MEIGLTAPRRPFTSQCLQASQTQGSILLMSSLGSGARGAIPRFLGLEYSFLEGERVQKGYPGRGRGPRTREAKAKEVRRPGDEVAGSTEEPLCRLELGPDWKPPSHWVFRGQERNWALRPRDKEPCRRLLLLSPTQFPVIRAPAGLQSERIQPPLPSRKAPPCSRSAF